MTEVMTKTGYIIIGGFIKIMNIMLFSRIVAKSGVGNHMKQLSEELDRQGHKVVVVSSTNEQKIGSGGGGVTFIELSPITLNPIDVVRGIVALHRIIKNYEIEVVHCHHRMAALYMKFYRMIFRVPVVYTLHLADIPHDILHRCMTFTGDKAIGVSTEVSKFMINGLNVPSDKVVTICNGVNEGDLVPTTAAEKKELRLRYQIPEHKTVFAMHSRIAEVKNHLLVVEAVKKLPDSYKDRVVFICSGDKSGSYYEKVTEKIREYKLTDCFIFTGWAKTREILGVADALILPSTNEGLSLTCVESFFMRIPVLCTKTSGFTDLRYCTEISYEPSEVAKTLMDFLDIGEDKAVIEEAYQYAMDNFTLAKMAEKTVMVYEEAMKLSKQGK